MSESNESDETVTVTPCGIFGDMIGLTIGGVMLAYLIIFYGKIGDDLKDNVITRYFYIMIILQICGVAIYVKNTLVDMCLCGQEMTKIAYNRAQCLGFPTIGNIINLLWLIVAGVMNILFTLKFVPFNHQNCHGYSYALCIYGRIFGFTGVIFFIIFGISALMVPCLLCGIIANGPSILGKVFGFHQEEPLTNTVNINV